LSVFLKNEFAAGGSVDLAPLETWVELWVTNDSDYDQAMSIQAMSIIENFQKSGDKADWLCQSCGEENSGSFKFCWNCQNTCPE
jgi:hypothetical protein